MTRRARWLGIASTVLALAVAPQAAATLKPKAKFRVVSVTGRESLIFHEDGQNSEGARCVGTTESHVSWRSTRPLIVYVFVRRGGRVRTILSADRVAQNYEFVPVVGEGTVSRSVSYQETAGCEEEPAGCPERTARAEPFLTGTFERRGSVNGGLDVVPLPPGPDRDHDCGNARPIAAGLRLPYGYAAVRAFPLPTASAFAIPRGRLLDADRMRLKDPVTVKEPLAGTYDLDGQATVSGTYTDHLAITLKRLKP